MFAKHLRVVGDEFRKKYLQSTDEADRTQYKEDWTQMKVNILNTLFPITNISLMCSWLCAVGHGGTYMSDTLPLTLRWTHMFLVHLLPV